MALHFFTRKRPDGTQDKVPISPVQPRVRNPFSPENASSPPPTSMIASPYGYNQAPYPVMAYQPQTGVQPYVPPQTQQVSEEPSQKSVEEQEEQMTGNMPVEKIRKTLTDAFITTETQEENEYTVKNQVIEIFTTVSAKHHTIMKFMHLFDDTIKKMAEFKVTLVRLDAYEFNQGLKVHKMTEELAKVEKYCEKLYTEMTELQEKIDQHYPELAQKWQSIIASQARIGRALSDSQGAIKALIYGGDSVSLGKYS